jgi:RAT1-interacting protein
MGENLEGGFERFEKFGEVDEHLDSLVRAVKEFEERGGKEVVVDVVTWRGMMTKIMTVQTRGVWLNRHRSRDVTRGV